MTVQTRPRYAPSIDERPESRPDLSLNRAGFEVRSTFVTPIVLAPVNEGADLNKELLPIILGHAQGAGGVVRSNQGGWQSDDDFAAWSGSAGARLLAMATALADSLTARQDEHGLQPVRVAWRVNAWANVNSHGHANAAHHHPGAFWSCVYWVQCGAPDEGGELEIMDPRGILPGFIAPQLRYALPGCLSAGGSDFITPVAGTMMLFPSWLVHAVRPFRGTGPRVSVAINLSPA